MGDYLIVSGADITPNAHALAARVRHFAERSGMTISEVSGSTWIGTDGPNPPDQVAVGAWTLVGQVLNRENIRLPADDSDDPYLYERKLMMRFWGRYVGIRLGANGRIAAVLRDPSGALECIVWTHRDLTFVSSGLPAWLVEQLRPAWTIDYKRLGLTLRNPLLSAGALCLDGPTSIEPGTTRSLPLPGKSEALWRPMDHVRRGRAEGLSPTEASNRLRSSIDESVRGLGKGFRTLAAEVSGGLDSSIVASSLVDQRVGPVQLWLNAYGDTPQSDERLYVQSLAEFLHIQPECVPLTRGPLTEDALLEVSTGPRPGINGLDTMQDASWAARLSVVGANCVFTGKGGDSILVHGADVDVFTDRWMAQGWRSILSPDVHRLALLNECSIWTMVCHARRHVREGTALPLRDSGLLMCAEDAPYSHPWLEGSQEFGPAKALQIAGVIDNISRHGPTLQTRVVDVLHPLCSQPVVEACLATPTPLMTYGGRNRGLARLAFADRLPSLIIDRRSKADLTSIYGMRVLNSLTFLRPWLLDGLLAANGIIDRVAAEEILKKESLMWRGRYGEIVMAAAFEGWARAWDQRLPPPG